MLWYVYVRGTTHDSGGGTGTARARNVDMEQTVKLELVKRSEKRQQTTFFLSSPLFVLATKQIISQECSRAC